MTWIAPEVAFEGGSTAADERTMLAGYLRWHRTVLLQKCAGLSGEALARRTVEPSTLSLLGLIRHLAKVERIWVRQRYAAEPIERLHPGKDEDFDEVDPAEAEAEYERLRDEVQRADKILAEAPLDDTFTHNGGTFSVRFLYLHLIQEYARHNGHADLLRERTDGATGD